MLLRAVLVPALAGILALSCSIESPETTGSAPPAAEDDAAPADRAPRDSPPTPDDGVGNGVGNDVDDGLETGDARRASDRDARAGLEGRVAIDGSSTVYPLSEAVVGRFEAMAPNVDVTLGVSGTGGGFAHFCRGRIDIADASRPLKDEERALCAEHGIDFIELPVAFDGISVVAHPQATWIDCLTVDELRRLWRPEADGVVTRWSQLRADWPSATISLYAPGHDSGTFDYFTRAVVGVEGSARHDFIGSEDDYLIAQDVAGDRHGLGFFGFAYYAEYRDRLRLVAIDGGEGCVAPSARTIAAGTYTPLARPVFLYVSAAALDRPAVAAFLDLYLATAPELAAQVGYVPLPRRAYELGRQRLDARHVGSVFDGGSQIGVSIESLLEPRR
ncbi:MAG: PstS family phosphate ABC transporter substrate-binding protein [Acidobacteriota bacterium]